MSAMRWNKKEAYQKNLLGLCLNAFTILWQETLTELLPGLSLIETNGHAPGHQSVLVHPPQTGNVLLAIDAVVMQRLFTTDRRAWPIDDSEEQLRASTGKLLAVVEREYVGLVVFGHDGEQ